MAALEELRDTVNNYRHQDMPLQSVKDNLNVLFDEVEGMNGSSQTVFQTTTTLTDSQIKTLPSVYPGIEVVPAVGTGKVAVFLQAILQTVGFKTHPYTNIDPNGVLVLRQGSVGIGTDVFNTSSPLKQYLSFLLDQSGQEPEQDITFLLPTFEYNSDWGGAVPYAAASSGTENAAFYLGINSSSGDLTGGDASNKLAVTAIYALVNLIS